MRKPLTTAVKLNSTCGLVCALGLIIFVFPAVARAECGGYVTIGNKAKAEELRAAGFDVGGKMDSHKGNTSRISNFSPLKQPKLGRSDQSDHQQFDGGSLPIRLPCSGPNCNSNRRSNPVPQPISLTITAAKPGLGDAAKISFDRESSFHGFVSSDDRPISLTGSLDRPPE